MKHLEDFNFTGKTVLVRCDLNVSFSKEGKILDDLRIISSLPTIEYLIKEKVKIVLLNHFTNLENEEKTFSLIHSKLEELLGKNVFLLENYKGKKIENLIEKSSLGSVFLLPDIRKYKGEKENSRAFAEEISRLGEIYVNDAFSVSHRNHASLVQLPEILSSGIGVSFAKEIKVLSKAISDPWRPLVVIIGGAKVSSKIRALKSFLGVADHLLLGGKLVNEILAIKGISPRESSLPEEITKEIKEIALTSPKIHLPVDVVASSNYNGEFYTRITGPGTIRKNEDIFDIGTETIKIYSEIIKSAKMIIWAGPLGLFEEKRFEKGTKEIARAISMNHKAFKIVGGGDTGVALEKFGFKKTIDHISTGGGAMLEFLSGNKLPGLKALGYYTNK